MSLQSCAVIGCGDVGSATAFALCMSNLFTDLLLIDIDEKKAQGEAMDLNHATAFLSPCRVSAGQYSDLADCGIIIITAGAKQGADETRIDLVHKNIAIYQSIIPGICAYNQSAILLVISNPVDIMTYAAMKLSQFPANRVIGSGTVLDSARLKVLLGEHLQVDHRNVHAFITGEHGDSELPIWSSANISGIPLMEYCEHLHIAEDLPSLQTIFEEVKNSAYEIIGNKGSTCYGIAMATLRIVEAIIRDENAIMPISCYVQSEDQLRGLYIGQPAIIGKEGVKHILTIPFNKQEQEQLLASMQLIQDVINDSCGSL